MKLDKLPVYYQELEVEGLNDIEEVKGVTPSPSDYHANKEHKPRIFYKAISKIVAFGISNKQSI